MLRIIVLFVILNFSYTFALTGNIEYTEASARVEAFLDVEQKIEKTEYKDYLKDPNYKENMEFIKNNILEVENKRLLCPFYLKNTLVSYSVIYNENPMKVYYYNILGSLVRFDIVTKKDFPRKTLGYSRHGNLISVAFEVNKDEQFMYDEKGKLTAHWKDKEMSDKNNQIPRFLKLKRGLK